MSVIGSNRNAACRDHSNPPADNHYLIEEAVPRRYAFPVYSRLLY